MGPYNQRLFDTTQEHLEEIDFNTAKENLGEATVEEKLGEARILWFFGTQNWASEVSYFSSWSWDVLK